MQASKASLVFEKIKTEFNTARRDRCIYVKIDENNSWADLFESILDGLASSFGSLLTQAQEDVRKMDSQRLIPGFNFCNFFMLKEGLAEAYECLGMHEEAYLTYHELDAAFFQCVDSAMQKDTSPWSENYGATEPGDDSVDITSSTCKSYHSRLADNTISIFDFRNYSFARQCHLMVRLGRPVEICTRARWHIGISVRSLRQRNFARFFIPSWIYSACMSVVKLTDWLVHSLNMGNNSMFFARYDAAKVGLLHEARRQLDVLGKEFGYLKCFVDPLICETDTQIDGSQQPIGITNPDLLNLMQSRQEFNERYVAQTEHLIKIYESSLNYQNAARLLRCDLGSLWFYSGQWREAAKVFLHCIDWPLISGERGVDGSIIMEEPFSAGGSERRLPQMNLFEIDALLKWCRTSRELQNSLLYLQQCSLLLANHDLLSAAQIEYCLKALRSEELSTFLTINSKGLLNFTIEQTAIGKDCTLEALVRSLISVPVNLDRILVVVYGPGGFEATFQSDQLPLLTYGEQVSITLRCPTTTPNGSYVLGHCVASIGRLQLKTSFMELGKTKQNIQIGRHPDAVNLTIYRPPVWHANEAFPDDLAYTALVTEFLVSIHSNSGAIAAGSLVKLSTDPFIILADDNYQLKANINRLPSAAGNQRTTVENVLISGQSIQLDFPIEAGSVVQIAVPFIVDIATPAESVATAFKVYCSFEYRSTASAPAVTICQSEAMISLRNDLSLRSFIVQQTSKYAQLTLIFKAVKL
jgi:hypothetical protein